MVWKEKGARRSKAAKKAWIKIRERSNITKEEILEILIKQRKQLTLAINALKRNLK